MVKNIFIIRHAEANSATKAMINDIDRTLSADGIKDATKMGECLKNKNVKFDKIITSSASRAVHTGVIIARQTGFDVKVISVCEELYLASVDKIIEKLQNSEEKYTTVGLVAHNPGVTEFAYLTEQFINVKTCGVLHYQTDIENWKDLKIGNLNFKSYICSEVLSV
ncbi:MAG: histidine phosphatase family protein [Chitinophagales bacterium]